MFQFCQLYNFLFNGGSYFGLLFFFLGLSASCSAQHDLQITINGIKKIEGTIYLGLFNNEADYKKTDQVCRNLIVPVTKNTEQCAFEDLPAGIYAIAFFQDENANEQIDFNFLGIPKEHFGFSNDPKIRFSMPDYEEVNFEVSKDTAISITVKSLIQHLFGS